MGKNRFTKIKLKFKTGARQSKAYFQALDEATKLRFNSLELEKRILHGVPGTKGLLGNKRYLGLSDANKAQALIIVHEECFYKTLWKPKELVGVARHIEKRLKRECG